MIMRTRYLVYLLFLTAMSNARCGGKVADDDQKLTDTGGPSALQLEWQFQADPAVKAVVSELLAEATSRPDGPPEGGPGVLYDFSMSGESRFLLLTHTRAGPSDPNPTATLFVLQEGVPRVSAPLSAGLWSLGGFGPVTIRDFDGDNEPDVAFCLWPEDETADGDAVVHGYADGAWYTIDSPQSAPPECLVAPR